MPELDRQIAVTFEMTTRNDRGRPISVPTTLNLWASRRDTGADRFLETGGIRGQSRRNYRIRWNKDLLTAFENGENIRVVDPDGANFDQVSIVISEPYPSEKRAIRRRQYLDLTVEGST